MLRVSPHQRPRLAEIIHNLHERIAEARMNGWLGEVQGLEVSLKAAKRKLARCPFTGCRELASADGGEWR
jgi:hypothetical protein